MESRYTFKPNPRRASLRSLTKNSQWHRFWNERSDAATAEVATVVAASFACAPGVLPMAASATTFPSAGIFSVAASGADAIAPAGGCNATTQ